LAREFNSGIAEVIKYGAIRDEQILTEIESRHDELVMRQPAACNAIVEKCAKIKAEIVSNDETEQKGIRAILNFGHTIGHALEQALGYRDLSHGEAVMVGMICEAEIGARLGRTDPNLRGRLEALAKSWALPTQIPSSVSKDAMMQAMTLDKKNRDGKIVVAVPEKPGTCALITDVDKTVVMEALDTL
jgi:3-dehydroquinate synthase